MADTDASPRLRRAYVDAPWGQVHVAHVGSSGPCVVLVHQTPRSWDEFAEVMTLLAGEMRLVALDLPGMGASDPGGDPPTIELYADAVDAVTDAFALDRFHVVGHHTGGAVAIEVAARHPRSVLSIVLSSTPWIDEAAREARRGNPPPVDIAEPVADGSHLVSLWEQRRAFYPERRELLDRYMIDAVRAHDPAAGHRAVGNFHMEERAPWVRCPVLVLEHDADPFAVRHTARLTDAFPGASLVSIAGGSIPLEHAARQVAEEIRRFIT